MIGLDFATRLLHSGNEIDEETGASSIPIYHASTFHHRDLNHPPKHDYTRSGNRTREALENVIAHLENGTHGFAFASGMAAISTVFFKFSSGDHLIVPEDVYGGTYRFLTQVLKRMNIAVSFVDMTDLDKVKAALRPNTKAVYLETPSNPILKITDIRAVADFARSHGILTLIDNTFMTPYLQKPLDLGADIVIHSATKFIGGHSDVLAGLVVVKDEALAKEIRLLQVSIGGVLGPQDAWLLLRGVKTLKARMDVAQKNARRLAEWLAANPKVERVYYPGLKTHPGYALHREQSAGAGAVVSFDMGSKEAAVQLMRRVKLPLVAVSLGSVESILSYPAMMSHASVPREIRLERGITDGLLRFSVGIEDADDLIADLEQAMA
jgi:cystathionine beta-lyase